MDEGKVKGIFITLAKTIASAIVVALTSLIANAFGGDGNVVGLIGASVATSVMVS